MAPEIQWSQKKDRSKKSRAQDLERGGRIYAGIVMKRRYEPLYMHNY